MRDLKFLFGFPLLALTALMGTSCDDDDEGTGVELPTVEVGEVALASETEQNAVVTITPSENTETWYWKCEETGGATASYTSVEGNEETQLSIPVELDTDYTLTVYAENEVGRSEDVTKNFNISSADIEGDLVTFEIKNLSALSVDVEVKKNVKCTRYAIGAVAKYNDMDGTLVENYNEATFIESAQRSLNPDENYPFRPYNTSDKSDVFTELTLNKASAEDDVNSGLIFSQGETYVVGVYALDANGEGTLFTKEFEVPALDVTKGQANVNITVGEEDMTLTSVAATFSADANCAKIITSIVHKSTLDNSNFDGMTEEGKAAFLAETTAQCPQPYTGEFRREFQTEFSPSEKFVVWAVPIDANGNIGKVKYYEGVTPGFTLDGKGEITAATITQDTYDKVNISLTLNSEAKKVRLIFLDDMSFSTNVGDDLDWVMYDKENLGHLWAQNLNDPDEDNEIDASEAGNIVVESYSPGAWYRIYAATVDADGKVSEPVNVAELAGRATETGYFMSMAKPEEEFSFDGTGEVAFSVVNEENVDGTINLEFKVEKGANTVKAWYTRNSNAFAAEEAIATLEQSFKNSAPELPFMWEITFDENGSFTGKCEYMLAPDNAGLPAGFGWPGEFLLIVTQDTDDKYQVAKVYEAGTTIAAQ